MKKLDEDVHIHSLCGCCWQVILQHNSNRDGYCKDCSLKFNKNHSVPCGAWSPDMVKAFNENGFLDRAWYNMETRKLNRKNYKPRATK